MYMIYIDADNKKIAENGMAPEVFWETIKVNLEDNNFLQLKENNHYYVNWKEDATLGHCWAFQSAFANDLPECVRSMTEYTLYEVRKQSDDSLNEEDAQRFELLKTFEGFSGKNIALKRNASYLKNMLHELDLIKRKGKRKKKPINFKHI